MHVLVRMRLRMDALMHAHKDECRAVMKIFGVQTDIYPA